MSKLGAYLNLIRFFNPIGFWLLLWPALWGVFIEPGFQLKHFAIVVLGAFLTRSLGCAINDILDRNYDNKVERTKGRPLANGDLSLMQALIFATLIGITCIFLLLQTNTFTINLVFTLAVPLIIFYPLAKRFIGAPQLILGITFGLSLPISYAIVHSNINADALFLYLACIFWIIAYDSYYALSDLEDDIKININSLPQLFGASTLKVINVFYGLFVLMMTLFAIHNSYEILKIGVLFLIYQGYYQYQLGLDHKFMQAFKSNSHVGLVIAMIFFIENQNEFFS